MLEKEGLDFEIIRTRDPEIIKNGDYVYDVGGVYDEKANRFDHHQKDFNEKRENGILYSSFGLVWKKFGEELCGSKEIANRVDKRIVQQIDANDNGISISTSIIPNVIPYGIHDVIFTFHPNFKEENPDDYGTFLKSLEFVKSILLKEIEEARDLDYIHKYIFNVINNNKSDSKILILDEFVPREKIYVEMVDYPNFLFVVAPRNIKKEDWKLIILLKKIGSFEGRKFLPKSWAGLRDVELQNVTEVKDAIFCHRALFMAIAKTKEGAIKLAELALNS